ncbi:MAG: hypothetical protein ACYDH5_00510 [Acidimicrobiales bacterium]
MATTPSGGGYWIAASTGRVSNCGNAANYSQLSSAPPSPIVGIATTPGGGGFWLAGANGAVYSFGNAKFYGSMAGTALNKPIVGIASDPATGGGIFDFGNAGFFGSAV